jgi:hypothetical protein
VSAPGDSEHSPEYVAARRVLLDALDALGAQQVAVVLAGAQAIYLRTGPNSLPIAEFTTDGDLAVDPTQLADVPLLAELMEAGGFELAKFGATEEPGIWQKETRIDGVEMVVPVDLLVPAGVAPPGGTRGARLGTHGKRAARKTPGLEAVLVDNDVMRIEALEPTDRRRAHLRVAGTAALLVAKTHKINDRVKSHRADRLVDKDASDIVRLMQTSSPQVVAETFSGLLEDPAAGPPTEFAIEHLRLLFGSRAGVGIEMAIRALREAMPAERVRAICLAYCDQLDESMLPAP